MRIAITGPTGQIGHQLVQLLATAPDPELVLIARNPDKVQLPVKVNAPADIVVVQADLEDARALSPATIGAEALFLLIPPKPDAADFLAYQVRVAENAAAAVREHDIKHVVLVSSIGGHLDAGTGPIVGLHRAESILRASATGLTILRPGSFMENFFQSTPTIQQDGIVALPAPADLTVPLVATQDIAAKAAEALLLPPPDGVQVWEFAGPGDYTLTQVAEVLSGALGKPVTFIEIPPEVTRQHLLDAGISADVANKYLEMYMGMRSGIVRFEGTPERTPTSFDEFARSTFAPTFGLTVVA